MKDAAEAISRHSMFDVDHRSSPRRNSLSRNRLRANDCGNPCTPAGEHYNILPISPNSAKAGAGEPPCRFLRHFRGAGSETDPGYFQAPARQLTPSAGAELVVPAELKDYSRTRASADRPPSRP